MSIQEKELVRLSNISKTFPGVRALKGVSLAVQAGEIHALVGENGAGKSTLIKVLTGAHMADPGGEIYVEGQLTEIPNPAAALSLGIGAVYQDVMMAPHLSVGENLFLGKLPRKGPFIDWPRVQKETREALAQIDVDIDPSVLLKDLPIAKQEMVAIGKIVHEHAKVIIFDEPTALLTNEEVEQLFSLIFRLKEAGCGIIYISHRLEEIFRICDTVTVLKDGQLVTTLPARELDEERLISLMVGRKLEEMYSIERQVPGEVVLEARNLKRDRVFDDISFQVRRGEIFGMYGLVGSGRSEVMRAITGADPLDSGEVLIDGVPAHIKNPKQSIQQGLAFLTEDRKRYGLALNMSVNFNVNLASYDAISKRGLVSLSKEARRANHYVDEINIKTPSIKQLTRNLSGGNQQKVVIGRWLACNSKLFIFDEPTIGVDVGAKVEIYRLFEELLKNGASIIVISSYLPEVMGLSDRIAVMSEGRIIDEVPREEFYVNGVMDEERLVRLASGLTA